MLIRRLIPAVIVLLIVSPVVFPIFNLIYNPAAWAVWREGDRIILLLKNTVLLAFGAAAIAVPSGSILAIAITRYSIPGEIILRAVLLIALFIPLSVYAVAWQIVLGNWLPSLSLDPGQVAWRPWQQGLLPAAVVHGCAGIPWVVWIVSSVLQRTDMGLDDEARIDGGWYKLWKWVLWPRVQLALWMAFGWIVVQAMTEIPISDAMMVRTFAEESYTEMVGNPSGVSAAIAVNIPVWLMASIFVFVFFSRLAHSSSTVVESTQILTSQKEATSILAAGFSWLIVFIASGLPVLALLFKAAGSGTEEGIRPNFLLNNIIVQIRDSGSVIAESLFAAVIAGILCSLLAWYVCSVWGNQRRRLQLLLGMIVALWLVPGPILGMGINDGIQFLLDGEDAFHRLIGWTPQNPFLRSILYVQPTPIPAMITSIIRFFPLSVVMILPAVRSIPLELWDEAKSDGLSRMKWFRNVLKPISGNAVFRSAVAVAVLSLGEVSASKLVNPPGQRMYILDLFNQMHYGAEAIVAALCLLQIFMTAGVLFTAQFAFNRSPFDGRLVS